MKRSSNEYAEYVPVWHPTELELTVTVACRSIFEPTWFLQILDFDGLGLAEGALIF